MRKRKRKKVVKRRIIRRKPLTLGDTVTINWESHGLWHGKVGRFIKYNQCWDTDDTGHSYNCSTPLICLDNTNFYAIPRRYLKDVEPETKKSHDYYTMLTGGLDEILAT